MDDETLKIHFEQFAEDSSIEITTRQLNKFFNLAKELRDEDITFDELVEEFTSVSPGDSEEWEEFIEAISEFMFEIINDSYTDNTEE